MKNSGSIFKRLGSALLLLPIYVVFMWFGGFNYLTIFILSSCISLACLYEYYQIVLGTECGRPFLKEGLVAAFLVNVLVYLFAFGKILGTTSYIAEFDARWIIALLAVLLVFIMARQIFMREIKGGIFSLAVTLFGVVFIALFFAHIILVRSLANGFYYLIMLHAIVMINDTFAYFGGSLFGKHKSGLAVSPNKSWEGFFSGILFSIIASVIFNQFYITFFDVTLFGTVEAALVGLFFAVAGDIGDLIESAIKRDGKVKDSGTIIPGHGGMWDVFDALIFSLPLFYYYLKIRGVQ
ncbi:MAG TPA: phosphatidate cytidylyltransferase [Spirochaetota bacterium]